MAFGLYIHLPFCRARCAYCDFNSSTGLETWFERYAEALIEEMAQASEQHRGQAPRRGQSGPAVGTVYLGGGTPTLLPLAVLERILEGAGQAFCLAADAEVSIEANPGTVDAEMLRALRGMGVNRLSLGVQSLDDGELRMLGRIHTAAEAIEAVDGARRAGFDNVNLDLIYGLPGQALSQWKDTLERAVALQPEHLSCYALSVEEGTPLAAEIACGTLPEPDPDLAADMYELAEEWLTAERWGHYEISNWTRGSRHECRHNLGYWRNEPYLGVGAGAHSWAGRLRWANVAWPPDYAARLLAGQSPVAFEETIGPELEIGETMMMGLRLVEEGVGYERFRGRFGQDLRQRFSAELRELEESGLIAVEADRVRLTPRGRLLGNQAFGRFLPD